MAVCLYLIKVSRTLRQSRSPGLSGFDWLCLLPFNVKWQTEDMSFSYPLSFRGSCPWMEETRKERGRGEGGGRCEMNGTSFSIYFSVCFSFSKSFNLSIPILSPDSPLSIFMSESSLYVNKCCAARSVYP